MAISYKLHLYTARVLRVCNHSTYTKRYNTSQEKNKISGDRLKVLQHAAEVCVHKYQCEHLKELKCCLQVICIHKGWFLELRLSAVFFHPLPKMPR